MANLPPAGIDPDRDDPSTNAAGPSSKDARVQAARRAFMAGAEAKTSHETSSQHRRWTYTRSELKRIREEINEKTAAVCRENIAKEQALAASGAQTQHNPSAPGHEAASSSKPYKPPVMPESFPTAADELLLVRFYCKQLVALVQSGALKTGSGRDPPEVILPLAITFLKRFYLRTSCLEWHPKVIMPVCLFLAGKTANHVFDIDSYVSIFDKMKKEDILDMEYLVLQTLRFDLFVPRIQHALHGWYIKLQSLGGDADRIDAAYAKAKQHLAQSRLSDAELHHTPSQIAAACMLMADEELFEPCLRAMVSYHYQPKIDEDTPAPEQDPVQHAESALKAALGDIAQCIKEIPPEFDLKKVKVVSKAIQNAQDPAKSKTSLLYRQQQDALLALAAEKRAARLAKARHEMNEQETMFGPVIGNHAKGHLGETGMGVQADGGGMQFAGEGLRDVGLVLDDSDSD